VLTTPGIGRLIWWLRRNRFVKRAVLGPVALVLIGERDIGIFRRPDRCILMVASAATQERIVRQIGPSRDFDPEWGCSIVDGGDP
jgi:hypothetical protein